MLSKGIATMSAVLVLAACGGSTTAQGPTTASVAVQSGDLPKGMTRCDLTGDIGSFISREATPDPGTSKSASASWQDAQKNGATSAYTAVYADNTNHCAAIKSSSTDISATSYPLIINFVVKYKDDTSAAKAYSGETVFDFSSAKLRTGGQPVIEGTKTGLTQNSIVLNTSVLGQTFYIAFWQDRSFLVILYVINMDATSGKKIAAGVNGRIR